MVLGQCQRDGSHPGKENPQEVRAWAKEQSEPQLQGGESKGPRGWSLERIVWRLMVSSGVNKQICEACQRVKN